MCFFIFNFNIDYIWFIHFFIYNNTPIKNKYKNTFFKQKQNGEN